MGLDVHNVNFLRFAAKQKRFGRVATMGRQGLHVPKDKLAALMGREPRDYGTFCEEFLKAHFGATTVDSFDYSDFEGATHIIDLNKPTDISEQYDTVIDAGTLEHVYNVVQALKTVSQICASGGRIIHMLPANNFCGHGFWQFSPGLFFSLYSNDHGFRDTRVFLSDTTDAEYWYEAAPAYNGKDSNFMSAQAVHALVLTTKSKSDFNHDDVQQLEYLHHWDSPQTARDPDKSMKQKVKTALDGTILFSPLRSAYRMFSAPSLRKHPDLVGRKVCDLV